MHITYSMQSLKGRGIFCVLDWQEDIHGFTKFTICFDRVGETHTLIAKISNFIGRCEKEGKYDCTYGNTIFLSNDIMPGEEYTEKTLPSNYGFKLLSIEDATEEQSKKHQRSMKWVISRRDKKSFLFTNPDFKIEGFAGLTEPKLGESYYKTSDRNKDIVPVSEMDARIAISNSILAHRLYSM